VMLYFFTGEHGMFEYLSVIVCVFVTFCLKFGLVKAKF
jgi:hypothetical protein